MGKSVRCDSRIGCLFIACHFCSKKHRFILDFSVLSLYIRPSLCLSFDRTFMIGMNVFLFSLFRAFSFDLHG